ncbi:sulfatase-like hydrolase/transferase [Candidatus Bathyarchaeota archaeon]|nr:sulfatase-like hydrolase/transferase [Candidatus Bathyarchaeota archaeon]
MVDSAVNTRPNILLIFPDQHRGDWMPHDDATCYRLGMEPLPLRMPNVEHIMRDGVTFTNCMTPSPLCAPARACLASGLRYARARVPSNSFNYPVDQRTFYSVLKEAGYTVGGCGKFDLRKPEHFFAGTGWVPKMAKLGFSKGYAIDNGGKHDAIRCATTHVDEDGTRKKYKDPLEHEPVCPYMMYLKERGLMMDHVNDFAKRTKIFGVGLNAEPTTLPDYAYCDNWIGRNGMDIIKSFPTDAPWFLQVNFVCPHEPWDVTERMKEAWEDVRFPHSHRGNEYLREQEQAVRQNYAAMLENIDRNVGLFLEAIEARGDLDNTIIVYSSDHGEMLGDFSMWGKSVPWRGSTNVPLVISAPGIKGGRRVDALVETQDLVSTFTDFTGLEMPGARDSKSLHGILTGSIDQGHHRHFQVSELDTRSFGVISDGRYKLIMQRDDEGMEHYKLYDLNLDPWEDDDISGSNEDIMKELSKHYKDR